MATLYTNDDVADEAAALIALAEAAFLTSDFASHDVSVGNLVSLLTKIEIECVDFSQLNDFDPESGFYFDRLKSIFTINRRTIDKIYSAACSNPKVAHFSPEAIFQLIVALFVFHEVFHILQRLDRFEDIQLLKLQDDRLYLTNFDITADFVAVRLYALILNSQNDGAERSFLKLSLFLLDASYEIGFRAFDASPSYKAERGLSIRLAQHHLRNRLLNSSASYDDCMSIRFQLLSEQGTYLVVTLEDSISRIIAMGELPKSLAKRIHGAVQFNNNRLIYECLKHVDIAA